MAKLLLPSGLAQAKVNGVGPGGRAMEERIGGVIGMRDVGVLRQRTHPEERLIRALIAPAGSAPPLSRVSRVLLQ